MNEIWEELEGWGGRIKRYVRDKGDYTGPGHVEITRRIIIDALPHVFQSPPLHPTSSIYHSPFSYSPFPVLHPPFLFSLRLAPLLRAIDLYRADQRGYTNLMYRLRISRIEIPTGFNIFYYLPFLPFLFFLMSSFSIFLMRFLFFSIF